MIAYNFTKQGERLFFKLPKDIQHRILLKVEYYLKQPHPLYFAKRIVGSPVPSYRFQIGDYTAANKSLPPAAACPTANAASIRMPVIRIAQRFTPHISLPYVPVGPLCLSNPLPYFH